MDDLTVHLIDDDDGVRNSVKLMLEGAGYRCVEYSSAQQFLTSIIKTLPGCAIIDMNMPNMSGLELQSVMQEQAIHLPIIFMTGFGEIKTAVKAMKAGAFDFVEKPCHPDKLKHLIENAFARTRENHDEKIESFEASKRLSCLTTREKSVLNYLIIGDPNKIIAHKLGISTRTVEVHRARIMEKTQVKSLPELVRIALAASSSNIIDDKTDLAHHSN
jgi:two-component system, LuxR family, response regulator FixJ